jgi:hypothetical protein
MKKEQRNNVLPACEKRAIKGAKSRKSATQRHSLIKTPALKCATLFVSFEQNDAEKQKTAVRSRETTAALKKPCAELAFQRFAAAGGSCILFASILLPQLRLLMLSLG